MPGKICRFEPENPGQGGRDIQYLSCSVKRKIDIACIFYDQPEFLLVLPQLSFGLLPVRDIAKDDEAGKTIVVTEGGDR